MHMYVTGQEKETKIGLLILVKQENYKGYSPIHIMTYPQFSDQYFVFSDNTGPAGHRKVPCKEYSP